jgi:putative zinc finger/helix-turn-helix YgiT family protein
MDEKLIEKTMRDCPICSQMHLIEKWQRNSEAIIKDTTIQFQEVFFRCNNSDEEENEFTSGRMMSENLLRARDGYRTLKGLLTSSDIAEIRTKYVLSQADFALLLGWGEVTVTRYESKTIQDETYDEMMRMVNQNPYFALENLEQHKDNFPEDKYAQLHERIAQMVEDSRNSYQKQQEIMSLYIRHRNLTEYNGYKQLDLALINNIIGYFANHIPNLFKVKLMKLLWYADALYFKKHETALTGLVYQHKPYGALPIGYNELIFLPTVRVEEKQYHNGNMIYQVFPNASIDAKTLSEPMASVLDFVIGKFKDFTTQQIVDYMHQEKAYTDTSLNQFISFSYAKYIDETRVLDINSIPEMKAFESSDIAQVEF